MSVTTQTNPDDTGIGQRLKDSVLAAILTLVLCIPIIMLHAEADNDGALYLIYRPVTVAVKVKLSPVCVPAEESTTTVAELAAATTAVVSEPELVL